MVIICDNIHLGKLQYFTNPNRAAMNGDEFPKINQDFQGSGEGREVVMKFTQIIYTNQP